MCSDGCAGLSLLSVPRVMQSSCCAQAWQCSQTLTSPWQALTLLGSSGHYRSYCLSLYQAWPARPGDHVDGLWSRPPSSARKIPGAAALSLFLNERQQGFVKVSTPPPTPAHRQCYLCPPGVTANGRTGSWPSIITYEPCWQRKSYVLLLLVNV